MLVWPTSPWRGSILWVSNLLRRNLLRLAPRCPPLRRLSQRARVPVSRAVGVSKGVCLPLLSWSRRHVSRRVRVLAKGGVRQPLNSRAGRHASL